MNTVRSIYRQALGPAFADLHPQIQTRFGFDSGDHVASIGEGVMHQIWHGSPLVVPFLRFGTHRHIMFPERGAEIPFRVENYAFRDEHGREFVTWIRTFRFPGVERRFDAYMAIGPDGRTMVDYFGTHGHFASELSLSVAEDGGMVFDSGGHAFLLGGRKLPCPETLAGRAHVTERYDEARGCFRISVQVTNPIIGPIFGYEGEFQAHRVPVAELPEHVLPRRLPA
jgi:hypothetical protein